jgi:hypothetical protein
MRRQLFDPTARKCAAHASRRKGRMARAVMKRRNAASFANESPAGCFGRTKSMNPSVWSAKACHRGPR